MTDEQALMEDGWWFSIVEFPDCLRPHFDFGSPHPTCDAALEALSAAACGLGRKLAAGRKAVTS